MNDDKRHLQLRISPELRKELESVTAKYGLSAADTVRAILFFGIPVFDTITELSHELVRRLAENLKKEARADKKKTGNTRA
jgi:hypothetical protein